MSIRPPSDLTVLANYPLAPPPAGVESNFDYPSSRGRSLVINNIIFLILSCIAVSIRFYSKLIISRSKLCWDDGTILVATIGSTIHTALTINAVNIGYGRHLWDIRLISLRPDTLLQLNVVDIMYGITIYFVKLTLLLFYYKLFNIHRPTRLLINAGIAFCTLVAVAFVGLSSYRTSVCPKQIPTTASVCQSTSILMSNLGFGALNIFTDFYILVIPISRVQKLQITKQKKYALIIPFSLGFVACAMSVVRYAIIISTRHSKDTLFNAATTTQFSCVEMKLAIVCSCLVFVPPFYKSSKAGVSKTFSYIWTRAGSSKSQFGLLNHNKSSSFRHSHETVPAASVEQVMQRPATHESKRMAWEMQNMSHHQLAAVPRREP